MAGLTFKNAEAVKESIMASQKKEIVDLYNKWADEIGERAKYYSHKTTSSAPLSERYYKELQKQLRATSQEVSNEIYSKIKSNMYVMSDAVVKDNVDWLTSLGFAKDGVNAAFSLVPDEIVKSLITGQVYDSGWSLSKRIWDDNEATLKDIYQVVAKGVAQNSSIYEIAKNLEAYVRPEAKLPWNISAKDGTKIYKKKVDYNAQRLARTLVQHTYQQTFVATTQKNPFVLNYTWHSNGSRACELCKSRDGQIFGKNELPLDHPNGMCVMEPNISDDIYYAITDWFNSPEGTYPEIDKFVKDFMYVGKKTGKSKPSTSGEVTATKVTKAARRKVNSTGVPHKSWLGIIKKQTEAEMLEKEKIWLKQFSPAARRGILEYTSEEHMKMNEYLRLVSKGVDKAQAMMYADLTKKQLKNVEDMVNSLNSIGLDKNYVLRRGTDVGDIAGTFMEGNFVQNKRLLSSKTAEELNAMFAGATGQYNSFVSTSSIWDRGLSGDVEVIFYVPKGANGSSIMGISYYGVDEGEMLLNAGTTVKCVKIEKSDGHMNSNIRVFLEVITKKQ